MRHALPACDVVARRAAARTGGNAILPTWPSPRLGSPPMPPETYRALGIAELKVDAEGLAEVENELYKLNKRRKFLEDRIKTGKDWLVGGRPVTAVPSAEVWLHACKQGVAYGQHSLWQVEGPVMWTDLNEGCPCYSVMQSLGSGN